MVSTGILSLSLSPYFMFFCVPQVSNERDRERFTNLPCPSNSSHSLPLLPRVFIFSLSLSLTIHSVVQLQEQEVTEL